MLKDRNMKQMWLLEDSLVNHSHKQEERKEHMTTDISGMKLLESLENVNPDGLLGKMLKALLTSKTAWYSDRCKMIWKNKVSKSNVLLYQLQASVLGIKEKEYGLLHIMYPTPRASDIEGGIVKDVQIKNGHFFRENKKGERWGVKLRDAVAKNKKPGGKLNPEFVEFLMGYPMNWTKIDLNE